MYSHKYNLILGFHGCDEDLRNKVVSGLEFLKESHNEYDWLGHGIYFWENNPDRALEWSEFLKKHPRKGKAKINKPAVLGAVIYLGRGVFLRKEKNYMKMQDLKKKTISKFVSGILIA